jgi:hypothetical protein
LGEEDDGTVGRPVPNCIASDANLSIAASSTSFSSASWSNRALADGNTTP